MKRAVRNTGAGSRDEKTTIKVRLPKGITKEQLRVVSALDGFKSISAWLTYALTQEINAVRDQHCLAHV